jgi:hypothetical protein
MTPGPTWAPGRVRLRLVDRPLLDQPGQPARIPFSNSCVRHDFGYRNYKAIGAFAANKSRARQRVPRRPQAGVRAATLVTAAACYSLAWTYYNAVRVLGSVVVSDKDVDRVAARYPGWRWPG